jgi:hypothetical protein
VVVVPVDQHNVDWSAGECLGRPEPGEPGSHDDDPFPIFAHVRTLWRVIFRSVGRRWRQLVVRTPAACRSVFHCSTNTGS